MTIGERIKQRRKELQLTLDELGKRLGKNKSTIHRYEKGEIENMPLDSLEPIADALLTTPAWLMGWEDDSTPNVTAERLTYLIESSVYSKTEIAEKANITKQTLYKYEKGIVTNIPISTIKILASILNTTPSYLLGIDDCIANGSTIGERIKNRRIELGMSQLELAIEMGYTSRSTISKIEKNINDISQSNMLMMAEVLKTTPEYLLGVETKNIPMFERFMHKLEEFNFSENELNKLEEYANFIISQRG